MIIMMMIICLSHTVTVESMSGKFPSRNFAN
jgi:hypothetical protein